VIVIEKDDAMLNNTPLRFDIPVSDLARAKQFYEERLGLAPNFENDYCAQYRFLQSYFVLTPSDSAGQAQHSLMTWIVEDIEAVRDWLAERGVIFEAYDIPGMKTVNGIATLETDRIAWFKDSEGNLLAIAEVNL
jgi:predicted enzyme related to lactoylglutathione lyase